MLEVLLLGSQSPDGVYVSGHCDYRRKKRVTRRSKCSRQVDRVLVTNGWYKQTGPTVLFYGVYPPKLLSLNKTVVRLPTFRD